MELFALLKTLFGDKPLTFDEFKAALEASKELKLANLTSGQYVDKNKFDEKVNELKAATDTNAELSNKIKAFDGVDVEKLKGEAAALQTKHETELAAVRLDSAVALALVAAKAKNPKLAKGALDLSKIKIDGDHLIGFDEQVKALKESDAYLFEADEGQEGDDGKGGKAAEGIRLNSGANHGGGGTPDYSKMSDEEYYKATLEKKG